MKMQYPMMIAAAAMLTLITLSAPANTLTWTGTGDGTSFADEDNWSTLPTGGTINLGNLVDDYIIVSAATSGPPNVSAVTFNGGSLTLQSGLMTMGLTFGISGTGSELIDVQGGVLTSQFFGGGSGVQVEVSGAGTATLKGTAGALPNGTTVNLVDNGAVFNFINQTPADFATNHLSKFSVNGSAAVVDSNLLVAPFSGATGSQITAATDYALAVKADGPQVWYKSNEAAGNTVMNNSAGAANDSSSISGVGFGSLGIEGRTGDFDGSGFADLDYNLDVSASSFSVEMLISPDALGSNLVQQLDGAGLGRTLLILNGDGSLSSFYGGSTQALTAAGLIETGQWAHVVLTVEQNGTTDAISIYVNGALKGTGVEDGEAADGMWRLGAHKNGGGKYNGLLDEFAVYDYALSDAQVLTHFQAATIPTPAALPAGLMMLGMLGLRRRKG